jgi:hypothetical protein
MSIAWLAALAAGGAFAQSLALLLLLAPRRLTGDEREYARADKPRHWVRVPGYGAFVRACMRLSRSAGAAPPGARAFPARLINGAVGAGAVGLAVYAAGALGGALAAGLAALLLLVSVERALLAVHLWPDTLLGLAVLAFALLSMQSGPEAFAGIALVVGLSVAIRIDSLVLLPAAAILAFLGGPQGLAPSLIGAAVALVLATFYNRARFGVSAPDTTFAYNAAVWVHDRAAQDAPTEALQRAAGATLRGDGVAPARPDVRLRDRLAGLTARLATLLGRETFLSDRLLDRTGNLARYRPGGQRRVRRWLGLALRWTTTVQMLLAVAVLPQTDPALAVPLGLGLTASALVATRSRYRVAYLPVMAVATAVALAGLVEGGIAVSALSAGGLAALALAVFLAAIPARREMAPAAPAASRVLRAVGTDPPR